jgi:hypothetical protein
MPKNYIDPGLKGLNILRDVLTKHRIEITDVSGVGSTMINGAGKLGYTGAVEGPAALLTLSVQVPLYCFKRSRKPR